jgi:hypothetical protein
MMEQFDDDEANFFMEMLLEHGLIEIYGVDPITEDITYTMTQKCQELMPELFQEHMNHINQLAFDLWEKGYIEMTFDKEGTPLVMLKDLDYEKDVFPSISFDEINFIQNMLSRRSK